MKNLIVSLVLTAAGLSGACPTSSDAASLSWPNTCFVALSGNDTTGTGTWSAPYLSVGRAYTAMGTGTGDSIVIRGGRYSGNANTVYQPTTAKCTALLPCTIRSYPGDVVIIDGAGMDNRGFYMDKFGSIDNVPPMSADPHDSHWRFVGLRIESVPGGIYWGQGVADDITLKAVRVIGEAGVSYSSCDGCQILGSHVELDGLGYEGAAFSCSGLLPTYYQSPWVAGSANGYMYTYWQFANETPKVLAGDAYPNGCTNLLVQDSYFRKAHSTSNDVFGFETATSVAMERVKVVAPPLQGEDRFWAVWGTQGGTDSLDVKGRLLNLKDIQALGGKSSLKLWSTANVERALVIGGLDSGENTLSAGENYMQWHSEEWPNGINYKTVRYVFNDSNNGDAVMVLSKILGGLGALRGTELDIRDVPGCTGINGRKLIKNVYAGMGYPVVFSISNVDGSQFTCPDAYDLSAHAFKIQPTAGTSFSPVTFTGSSTDVAVPGMTAMSGTYRLSVYPMDRIRFTTTGTLPAGLTPEVDYWITYATSSIVKVSATRNGTPITFADVGTGTHSAQVVDERTSYAGTVRPVTSTQDYRNVTVLSQRRSAAALGGSDFRDGTEGKYAFNDSVVASESAGTLAREYFMTASPRVYFTTSSATIALEYWDASLTVGSLVYFNGNCRLPSQLTEGTAYYIVAADSGAATIQVSATSGGTALVLSAPTGCLYANHWLTAAGINSPIVTTSNDSLAAGSTVTVGGIGDPPYPLVRGGSYYVATAATATVGGRSSRQITLKNASGDASPISFTKSPGRHDTYLEKDTYTGIVIANYLLTPWVTLLPSANNAYWSPTAAKSYCGKNQLQGATGADAVCVSTQGELDAQETASTMAVNPHLDYVTGRATTSSGTSMWNKGAYAGTLTVEPGTTTALIRWRAPQPTDVCSVDVASGPDFTAIYTTVSSPAGPHWRTAAATGLPTASVLHFRATCGYDVMTTSGSTLSATSATAPIVVNSTGAFDVQYGPAFGSSITAVVGVASIPAQPVGVAVPWRIVRGSAMTATGYSIP